MGSEQIVPIVFLVVAASIFGVWAFQNVWKGPKVLRAQVVEKEYQQSGERLPDVFPGTGGVFQAGTANVVVLEIQGQRQKYTANDESMRKVQVGDFIKAWIQGTSHIVGVYVLHRGTDGK